MESSVGVADVEAWDDEAIVKAFNFAMQSHRRKGDEDSAEAPRPREPEGATIGAWQPVDSTPATVGHAKPAEWAAAAPSFAGSHNPSAPAQHLPPPPGMTPPAPPMPTLGQGAGGLDDKALNDLLLAWYYRSGPLSLLYRFFCTIP